MITSWRLSQWVSHKRNKSLCHFSEILGLRGFCQEWSFTLVISSASFYFCLRSTLILWCKLKCWTSNLFKWVNGMDFPFPSSTGRFKNLLLRSNCHYKLREYHPGYCSAQRGTLAVLRSVSPIITFFADGWQTKSPWITFYNRTISWVLLFGIALSTVHYSYNRCNYKWSWCQLRQMCKTKSNKFNFRFSRWNKFWRLPNKVWCFCGIMCPFWMF